MRNLIAPCLAAMVAMVFAGAASAQPAAGSAAPAAGSAAPAAGSAAPAAGSASAGSAASAAAPVPAAQPPAAPGGLGDARKACTEAMNADPKFAASIVQIADARAAIAQANAEKQRDQDTIAAHNDAYVHIQKNEKHVIYAYAAMWIVAALFVIFLWRRQQALTTEIESLRRDLEAAAGDAPKGTA